MSVEVEIISGAHTGARFTIPDGRAVSIGRSNEADLQLMDGEVSRRHCSIVARGSECYVQDLGSSNGTFMNGQRIQSVQAPNGSVVLIGATQMRIWLQTPPPQPQQPPYPPQQQGQWAGQQPPAYQQGGPPPQAPPQQAPGSNPFAQTFENFQEGPPDGGDPYEQTLATRRPPGGFGPPPAQGGGPFEQTVDSHLQGGGPPSPFDDNEFIDLDALGGEDFLSLGNMGGPAAQQGGFKCADCGRPIREDMVLSDHVYSQSQELICDECRAQQQAVARSSAPPDEPLDGFEFIQQLGQGNTGTVYLAKHLYMGRLVAVKVLNREKAENERHVKRFLREGRSAAKLEHPNIVQVFDVGKWGDLYYICMEYVEGITLDQRIMQVGLLSEHETFAIADQVLQAMAYAFEHRIVHRDIKPQNIFLSNTGYAKLGDFGLAKDTEMSGMSGITTAGTSLGTMFYMPPEQMEDALKADHRSDIYAFGATLYHCLCGQPPFTEKSVYHLFNLVSKEPPPPMEQFNPNISAVAKQVVMRCLEKNPDDRYQAPGEMARELAQLGLV